MELEPLVILGILYAILSVFGRLVKGGKRQQPSTRPAPAQRAPNSQPTTFDDLLAEMRRQLEGAPEERHPDAILIEDWQQQEDVEDRTVWEEDATVVSMEVDPPNRERPRFDHDAAAAVLVQSRIDDAMERNRAWRLEDHRRFDQEIREKPQRRVTGLGTPQAFSLRQAMIWREILSPPVALREPQDRAGNASA